MESRTGRVTGCRRCGKRRGGRDDAESWGSGQLMVLLTEMKTTRVHRRNGGAPGQSCVQPHSSLHVFSLTRAFLNQFLRNCCILWCLFFLGYLISIQLGDLRCFASLSVVPAGEGPSDLLPN